MRLSPAGGLDLESLERFASYDSPALPPHDLTSKSGIILALIQEVRALRTALRRIETCAHWRGMQGRGDYRDIEADASMTLARGTPQP